MPLWGNNDKANSIPLFPELREVRPVASLVTANATTAGVTTIKFNKAIPASVNTGLYVYSNDANNSVSRLFKDLTIVDQNDIDFYRSNNTVASVTDRANGVLTLVNPTMGTLANGATVWFGTGINHTNQPVSFNANDVILVTTTRLGNTKGTLYGAGSNVANTKLGNLNTGWNRITRKINNDGTVRFLKETLVALANPTAANTQSGNTSANAIFGGL
jgi:hypothetical protein